MCSIQDKCLHIYFNRKQESSQCWFKFVNLDTIASTKICHITVQSHTTRTRFSSENYHFVHFLDHPHVALYNSFGCKPDRCTRPFHLRLPRSGRQPQHRPGQLVLEQRNLSWRTWAYRQISNIGRTKPKTLKVSCLVLELSLPNPLKSGIKSRMKM